MTVAFVTAAVLALLLLTDAGRGSRRGTPGRSRNVGLLERTGHSRAALLKGAAGLVLVAVALLGPVVARMIS